MTLLNNRLANRCATWLFPEPGGPKKCIFAAINKVAAGQLEEQTAIHLLVEAEVEVVERLEWIRKPACLRRRSSSRSPRLVSSSVTRQEMRSIGAMASLGLLQARLQHGGHAAEAQLS